MDRRRAAAALFALAACFACSTAAPTATNHTALDLFEAPTEGCYYNFQHYGEGDRIMTNEPCLNCTCHNRMLMCYLRVCPFTKPIGQDCTVEKRADQCCPIVTCPDVPVDLLTSTSTSSPAEYGTTGVGRQDKYGCSINGKYFSEGSKVPSTPNKPCEHCYCIRNMTTCVMQECTLHVDGCTPIYHKDVCCPVRYSCDHPEDEIPLLDDMTTTVRPTPGFLLTTTTTMVPVTQPSQECIHEDQIFPDGAHIKTEKACEHCYCMKGDIVCVVQECGTPMENEGKNCTALPLRFGQCCPDTYICEGDERGQDLTTEVIDQSTTPPRRVGIEGSGYRNEPDEPVKEIDLFETNVEGSGDENTFTTTVDIIENSAPDKESSETVDEMFTTTEREIYINPSTESNTEQIYVPDKDSPDLSSILPDQNQMSHTTEANSDFNSTTKEFMTTITDDHQVVDEFTSQKEATITTESAFRKEDNDIVADEILLHSEQHKGTTSFGDLTEETHNKEKPETDDGIDFTMSPEYEDKATTESIKYTPGDMDKTTQKDNIEIEKQTEITDKKTDEVVLETTSNKDIPAILTTTIPDKIELLDTTTINPIHNEIDENNGMTYPARIPGEGDCLLNGITYSNNTNVPRANNCHTSCKCVSSIIKCDPIICSPPPEYMENMNDCQPVYDSSDSCCPTYVCSAKETIPPQSHSQMSGTEIPKPMGTVECDKNDCAQGENDKQPLDTSGKHEQGDCSSNNCEDDVKKLLPKLPEDCSDNKCQVSPVVACEGDNCDIETTEKLESTADIDSDLKQEPPSNCNGEDGCKLPIDTTQDLCTDEICRRKEEPKIHNELPSECSGTECNTLNDLVVTSANEVDQSTESVLNKQEHDLESPAPTKAIIEENQTEPSKAEDINPTEMIKISVTSEPGLQTEIDKLFVTENESEHAKMPTTQSVPEKTEMEETKPIEHDISTGQEQSKVTEPQGLPEIYTNAGTTEKLSVEQKVTEKEQLGTVKEPLNSELPEIVETKLDDITKKIDSFTTESMHVDDLDTHKTMSEDIYTTLPNLSIEDKNTERPEPHIEMSYTDQLESSTINNKLHLVTETPTITEFESGKTDSTIHELLPKSTELPEAEYDSLTTTPRLPDVEIDKDTHDLSAVKDTEKDTFEESHTTQVSYVTSTHKDINVYDHSYNEADRKSTESVVSQSEMSERPDTEQPHDKITDKIENELQSVTEKLDDYTKDSTAASGVEVKTESTIISSDAPQPVHISEDELTTKSYEIITEENLVKEDDELLEYSTSKPEQPDYNVADKISDEKPLISVEYPSTERINMEETEQPVTEEKITKQPEALDTKSDEIVKVTEYPAIQNEDTATKIPDISLEILDQTSIVPEKEKTTMYESELSIKQEMSSESPSIYTISYDDQNGNKDEHITELPKISTTSTETIVTSPKIFEMLDKTDDIETEKPVDTQNEVNLFDDAQSQNTLSTKAQELTPKYSDSITEKSEVLTTESTTKYILNGDLSVQQLSSEAPKIDDKYSENQETETTLKDTALKEESTTIAHVESVTESQTNIPVVYDDKLEELITKTPEEIIPTEQSDKKHEIPSKEDGFISQNEETSLQLSTESQEINTEVVPEVQLHIETTLKPHNDGVEKSQEEIEEQTLNERTTLKPNEENINIEDNLKLSTPFVESYTTSKDVEKVTSSPNLIEEKDREQDVEASQADKDKKLSEITEKPSIEDVSPSQSTKESATIEAITEEIFVHTSEQTTSSNNDEKQQSINIKPEEPEIITKLEEVATTESISVVQHKDGFTELPEFSITSDDYVTLPVEDHKLNENKQKIPKDEDVPQLQTVSVLLPEKDKVTTELPYAFITGTDLQTLPEKIEGELDSSTKPSDNKILEEEEKRVPTPDVYVTHSQDQTSEVPDLSDKHETIPKQEISSDAILTSESPEKIFTAQIDTSTSIPQLGAIDEEETHDQSLPTVMPQTVSSDNVKPTETITVSELSELTTENPSTSKKEEEIQPIEEKKPSTESIISSEDISGLEHNVPVFVQGEQISTEMPLQEMTTLSSKLFNVENDEEFKITETVPIKPQDILTYDSTHAETATEGLEKETPFAVTAIGISTESSKISDSTKHTLIDGPIDIAQTETSTYFTESKEPEGPGYTERKTTETSISLEMDTATPSIIPITERQESQKPISVLETTEDYARVTEQKHSDIFSDFSTKMPAKDMIGLNEVTTSSPEEELITNGKIEQDNTVKPDSHVEIIQEEVTKLPEQFAPGTEDKTELFDKNELPSISPESVEKTSQAPIEQEVQSQGANTLLPIDINVPTEYVEVQKELGETTTAKIMVHVSDLDTMTNPPISTQKHQEVEETTELESAYSKTTPFSVELEEHTHLAVDESFSSVPTSEIPTKVDYEPHEPERGDMPDNEEQIKPSDATPIDFGDKENPVTSYQGITEPNYATTISPVQNNIEKEPSTDINFPTTSKSEEPGKDITTIHDEEIILVSSPQTVHEKDLYTTENVEIQQISSSTHGPLLSTERDLPTSSEIPIKPEIVQSTVSEKEIIEETSQATTGKLEEGSSTDSPIDKFSGSEEKLTSVSPSSSPVPELPKPVFNEEPIEDIATPDFPSSGAGGYGQEPDYVEEDQTFGPGTCRYGGKVYVSAQQIPRDDPCDFCFCFRSDIICLQQSCPPPIHGCHEEPIQGFCCPRYECPVSMATTLNMTTTTTTTTTTLPPHFLPHAYKGAAQRRGCQIKGHTYKVGEVVRASSGPCLHCTCGGDGQMKCDPKACTPEPMLRQMIAAAVSAKRRR